MVPVFGRYLENEGRADGGVEGAHAVHNGIGAADLLHHALVGLREHLMLLPGPIMREVEDPTNRRDHGRALRLLVHLAWPR